MADPTSLTLRSGERVTAEMVRGPAVDWADRLELMLRHKGDPWNWQNCALLRRAVSVESRFFILHREGRPFANIMVVETAGVGMLGHVWTEPADRGVGSSALLMERALDDFQSRGGRVLFLGTAFDSMPWHFYRRRGFEPVYPGSGYMGRYFQDRSAFERGWFDGAGARIEPLDWADWPAAAPLFLADSPGLVRIAATQLIGRTLPEGPLLPMVREQQERGEAGRPASAVVLRCPTGAVVGYASSHADPLWPERRVVDLYCHPGNWHRADELLAAIAPSAEAGAVAYVDADLPSRRSALERNGFSAVAVLPRWLTPTPGAFGAGRTVDVVVYVKP